MASPKRQVRLAIFLPVSLTTLLCTLVLTLILLNHAAATHSIQDLAQSLMAKISQHTLEKTIAYLNAASQFARLNQTLLAPKAGEEDYLYRFDQATRPQMEIHPHFGLVYFGDEGGHHWLTKRERDGSIRTRLVRRLVDDAASKEAFQKALAMPKESQEEKNAVAKLIAPYAQTLWKVKDDQGRFQDGEKDPYFVYDPRLRPWYQGAVAKKGLFWTSVYTWPDKFQGQVRHQIGITAALPVLQEGRLVGVTAIDIVLETLSRFLRDLRITPHGRVFILDDKGLAVGMPRFEDVVRSRPDAPGKVEQTPILEVSDTVMADSYRVLAEQTATAVKTPVVLKQERLFTFVSQGVPYFAYYRPFQPDHELAWMIGIIVPEEDFLGEINQKILWSLMISLLGVVLVVAAGFLLSRIIAHALAHISREALRISDLNLVPTPSLMTRFTEIAQVSMAFSRMKTSMREIVQNIAGNAQTLDTAAQELFAISANMAQSAGRIHENAVEVAGSSSRVSGNMQNMAHATREMNQRMGVLVQTAREMDHSMNTIASSARDASDNLSSVAGAAAEANQAMAQIRQSAEQTSGNVDLVAQSVEALRTSLGLVRDQCDAASRESNDARHHSKNNQAIMEKLIISVREIERVVEVINNIAEQTNMLALNAAIEAAGVGQAGKGFAVVANEVKTLAGHTGEATHMVSSHIEEIQTNAGEVGASAQQIMAIIERIDQSTADILGSVNSQSQAVARIASAMEQASGETREVTHRLNDASQGLDKATRNVTDIAGGIAEVTDSVVSASAEVANMTATVSSATQASQEIAQNVAEASKTVTQVAASTDNLHRAVRDIFTLSENVTHDARNVTHIAAALKEILNRFQIR